MVTEFILKEVYQELYYAKVPLEKTILKPNMVIAGKKCARQASRQEVAERTVSVLKRCVPPAVPGIAFLSGGQSDEDATAHLSLMNKLGPLPWALSFSYGRALQAAALKAWGGKSENLAAGQRAFSHRAKMNGAAALGKWSETMEKAAYRCPASRTFPGGTLSSSDIPRKAPSLRWPSWGSLRYSRTIDSGRRAKRLLGSPSFFLRCHFLPCADAARALRGEDFPRNVFPPPPHSTRAYPEQLMPWTI